MSPFRERFFDSLAHQYNKNPEENPILYEVMAALDKKVTNFNDLSTIIVLGASMDFTHTGRPLLHSIVESDKNRIVWGHSRARAARDICDRGYNNTFLVTGGSQLYKGQTISRAQTLGDFMTRKYGIPHEQVVVIGQEQSGYTLGNIDNTIEYLQTILESVQGTEVGLLTNEWHIYRSLLMFLSTPFLKEHSIGVTPVIADDILRGISPRHEKLVDDFQTHPKMAERCVLETNGSADFLTGNYQPEPLQIQNN